MVNIKVVGSGCPNCKKLGKLCKEVTTENDIEAKIKNMIDFNKFANLGIFITPGLLINDKMVSSGKSPTKSMLANWITEAEKTK